MKPILAALGLFTMITASANPNPSGPAAGHPIPHDTAPVCERCLGEPVPDSFCRATCGCTSAFCGRW